MGEVLHTVQNVSPAMASVLVASVWQGLLLTAGMAVTLRYAGSVSPTARVWIWTAVLLCVLALPALTLAVPHPSATPHAALHLAEPWSLGMLAVWALLSAAMGLRLGTQAVRLRRLAGRAKPVVVDAELARLLHSSRRAELCVSTEVDQPSVAGFFRPRVLVPMGLLESLSPAELAHVVLHEMEHLRRYDDWLNLLQQISLVLLPLHPALVWLDRRLCHERELACDDGVLRATHARKAYAACLVKLAEDSLVRKGVALALSALGTRAKESELVGRVRRILAGPDGLPQGRRTTLAAAVLGLATCAGVGMLVGSPQWVSFDGEPQLARLTEPTPSPANWNAVPVSTTMQPSPARPVLARAAMSGSAVHPVAVVAAMRRKARLRTMPTRVVTATSARALSAVAAGLPQEGHMEMTEFVASQRLYAAVPWRGGWLIVQL